MIWRRIRGICGVAITWGIAWGVLGSAWTLAQLWWVRRHNPALQTFSMLDVVPWMFFVWAVLGTLSGAIFAGLLARLERRRSIDELVPGRVAVWGALGGASLPLLAVALGALGGQAPIGWLSAPVIAGGLGALCAATSLRLAKRAARV
jgi:hypothetical protein